MLRKLCFLIFCFCICKASAQKKEDNSKNDSLSGITTLLAQSKFYDMSGKAFSLKDFKGKAVVLHFWEKNASKSVKSMMDLNQAAEKFGKNVVVLAVNLQITDHEQDIKKFAEENIYNFVYIPDKEKLASRLQVKKIPYKIFVNKEGKVIQHFSGAYPDVREFQRDKEWLAKSLE